MNNLIIQNNPISEQKTLYEQVQDQTYLITEESIKTEDKPKILLNQIVRLESDSYLHPSSADCKESLLNRLNLLNLESEESKSKESYSHFIENAESEKSNNGAQKSQSSNSKNIKDDTINSQENMMDFIYHSSENRESANTKGKQSYDVDLNI